MNVGSNVSSGTAGLTFGATTLSANTPVFDVAANATLTLGAVGGSGIGFAKADAGTLVLASSNTFTGGVTINAGVIQLGNASALSTASGVTFGASSTGILRLNGNSATILGLNTNATVGSPIIEDGNATAATLTVNTSGTNTYAGVLQNGAAGSLALTKSGTGTLTLAGSNTFSGTLTVQNGILSVPTVNDAGSAGPFGQSASAVVLGASRRHWGTLDTPEYCHERHSGHRQRLWWRGPDRWQWNGAYPKRTGFANG